MPHVYAAFGRFINIAFGAKFKLVIGKPCANIYLRHHIAPLTIKITQPQKAIKNKNINPHCLLMVLAPCRILLLNA